MRNQACDVKSDMTPKQTQSVLATALTTLAGYVDAIGYLKLGGTYVSFMSGNTTRLGADLGAGQPAKISTTAEVIALFLVGVIAGHLLRRTVRGNKQAVVLVLVTLLLVAAGSLQDAGWATAAITAAILAMGAENATFERDGEMKIGLTFVSSTMVKIGDHIADALVGGPRLGWVGPALRWAGFVGGAALGGFAFRQAGLDALWAAAAAAAFCTVASLAWRSND